MNHKRFQFNPEDYTVLAIDDTAANLMVVNGLLNQNGFRVLTARNGESGIQRAIHGRPDVILLDVMMPDINGFETCERLKSNPKTKGIPVIFMTALDDPEHKVRGFEAGGVDYVTKPIEQAELLARLKTHLINHQLTLNLEQEVKKRTAELSASLTREQELRQSLAIAFNKEQELNQLKSRIIETVNHEFRTPLTIINQVVWMFNNHFEKIEKEKLPDYSNRLKAATNTIVNLLQSLEATKNLANVEDIEIHKMRMSWKDFGECVQGTIAGLDGAPWVELTMTGTSDPTAVMVEVALEEVESVVKELVTNALKFSDESAPVEVHLDLMHGNLRLSVLDHGIGIPADEREKIFEAFYRASNVDARRGLGMGLFIVTQLTEAMGGDICLSDSPETEFVFTLPDAVQGRQTSQLRYIETKI